MKVVFPFVRSLSEPRSLPCQQQRFIIQQGDAFQQFALEGFEVLVVMN